MLLLFLEHLCPFVELSPCVAAPSPLHLPLPVNLSRGFNPVLVAACTAGVSGSDGLCTLFWPLLGHRSPVSFSALTARCERAVCVPLIPAPEIWN